MSSDEVLLTINAVLYATMFISLVLSFSVKKLASGEDVKTSEKVALVIVGVMFVLCVLGASL